MTGIHKLLIKSAHVVNADREIECIDILVCDGKVVKMECDLEAEAGVEVIDAKGKLVMPGGIDPHVHQLMPFMGTYSEDWPHTTAAALCGGTTCVIDFIIPGQKTKLADAIAQWEQNAKKSRCDYSFHMCVVNAEQVDDLPVCVAKGITSVKCFMAYKNSLMLDDACLLKAFAKCKELGMLVSVHAENGELVAHGQQRIFNMGITGPEGHPLSRPNHHEEEAAERAIIYAEDIGVPLCIVHNTTVGSVAAIRRAHEKGLRVYGEATAAHLVVTEERYFGDYSFDERAACVLSPPLRSEADRLALWHGLQGGTLCNVVTDHCGFTTAQKQAGKGDFRKIPNGMLGLEERMPMVWTLGVNTGRISRQQFVAITSTNTARMYNMYPRKGVVEVGADADFVIWDPELQHVISHKTHHSSLDLNPFEGFECVGYPSIVIACGRIAYMNGELRAQEGSGQYISRKPFGAVYDGVDKANAVATKKLLALKSC